jgi:hypothetical protein
MNLAVWAEPYGVRPAAAKAAGLRAPVCRWFRAGLLPVPARGVGHLVRDVTEVLSWMWARLCGTGAGGNRAPSTHPQLVRRPRSGVRPDGEV